MQIVDRVKIAIRIGQAKELVPVGNELVREAPGMVPPGQRHLHIPVLQKPVAKGHAQHIALAIKKQRAGIGLLHSEVIGYASRNTPAEPSLNLCTSLSRQGSQYGQGRLIQNR